MSNYIYKADAMVYGAGHRLLLNDIPFSADVTGAPLNAEIPLNEFLLSPKSAVSIELLPLQDDEALARGAEVNLTIKRYDLREDGNAGIPVYSFAKEPGELKDMPALLHKDSFESQPMIAKPEWHSAKVLDLADKGTIEAIYRYAEGIRSLFVAQNAPEILKQFSRKFRHYEEAYQLLLGDRQTVTGEKLQQVFADDGYQLAPFRPSIFLPKLYGYGRIATLQDNLGYSYLIYYHREREELVEFPIFICQDGEGRFYVSL